MAPHPLTPSPPPPPLTATANIRTSILKTIDSPYSQFGIDYHPILYQNKCQGFHFFLIGHWDLSKVFTKQGKCHGWSEILLKIEIQCVNPFNFKHCNIFLTSILTWFGTLVSLCFTQNLHLSVSPSSVPECSDYFQPQFSLQRII